MIAGSACPAGTSTQFTTWSTKVNKLSGARLVESLLTLDSYTVPPAKNRRVTKSATESVAAEGATPPKRQRLSPEHRERQIVEKAIGFFSEFGLKGQARELAGQIGITHPLLYHYFPNKQALIDRVYQEVYLGRWKVDWEEMIDDRTKPIQDRLTRFYLDYAKTVLTKEWVRILVFSGLAEGYITDNYMKLLSERLFPRIVRETRADLQLPLEPASTEAERELAWGLHGGIFYIGIRHWVYGQNFPADLETVVSGRVRAYVLAAPEVFKREAKLNQVPGRGRKVKLLDDGRGC
jgi:AcrR family transcriptional regulator